MKRWIAIGAVCLAVVGAGAYIYAIKFDLRRETLALHDTARNRDVPVEISVSRRAELKAILGWKPKVAIVNHGNTVRHDEYSFMSNILATQGYLVASVQHDLPGDAPLSQSGFPFVGRLPVYERGEKNILFAIDELKRRYPESDFTKITMLGHSNGGDISMFFVGNHPELVDRLVTLDNLRVPFLMSGKSRILSFRSNDWRPDPGVVPADDKCEDAGIELVKTDFQHVDMSDRGPEKVKETIKSVLARFLAEDKPSKKSDAKVFVNYSTSAP